MSFCAVLNCGSVSTKPGIGNNRISFHSFPKQNTRRRYEWIKATRNKKNWAPTDYSKICSLHFTEDCFFVTRRMKMLSTTAVPTLLLPTPDLDDDNEENDHFLKLQIDNNNILLQLGKIESLINNICDTNDNQFDIFSRIVAEQLKSLPLDHAVILKMKLEEVIFEYRKSLIEDRVIFPEIMNRTERINVTVRACRRVLPASQINNVNEVTTTDENTSLTQNTETNVNKEKLNSRTIKMSVEKPAMDNPVLIIDSEDEEQCDRKRINSINTAHFTPSVSEIPESNESFIIKEGEDKIPLLNLKIVSTNSLKEKSTSSDDDNVEGQSKIPPLNVKIVSTKSLKEEPTSCDDDDVDIKLTEETKHSDNNIIKVETSNDDLQRPNDNVKKSYVRVKRFALEAETPIQEAKKLKQ